MPERSLIDLQQYRRARHTVTELNAEAVRLRAELARLRRDLAETLHNFHATRAAQLMEANENLLLAVLQANQVAESAITDLDILTQISQRDPLTGTPNRTLMQDRLNQAISLAHRHGTRVAVLFLDLDNFKRINDTLGHGVGDAVLRQVAHCLQTVVRDSDAVSRHGGDEFLILLPEITQATDASMIATKILTALAQPTQIGDHTLRLGCCVGIALYPDDGMDATTLICRADTAMYHAKQHGRGQLAFYQHTPSSPMVTPPPGTAQPE
jgi:diguanylate cyclase